MLLDGRNNKKPVLALEIRAKTRTGSNADPRGKKRSERMGYFFSSSGMTPSAGLASMAPTILCGT